MNAIIFADWLRKQGYHVTKSQSSYWFNQGPRVYQAFPYHWILQPTEGELVEFLRAERALGLRYSTPLEAAQGTVSYHAIYDKATYGFDDLGKQARKNVRRGLAHCTIEPISFQRLADEGFALQIDTLDRQGRKLHVEQDLWRTRCLAARDLPGFEAWGALVGGRLAASVTTFQMENWCYMLDQQCHRDFLANRVNNALCFVVTQTMMQRNPIVSILYGLHSLDAPSSVDEFKFRMGYAAKPVRQRVVFHPRFAPLVNSTSHAILDGIHRIFSGSPKLAKAEGLVRFYLQGKEPLTRQPKPAALKEALIS